MGNHHPVQSMTDVASDRSQLTAQELSLQQTNVGMMGHVVSLEDRELCRSGIVLGELIQIMSVTARGSVIVKRASGEQMSLNHALTPCIRIKLIQLN
ncbi:hypothetical protein IQ266_01875 [filamentous cyanobacterium LEGE 11480]|uniref:Uncharacterized protein n=1 Tax=Romeriopsis navalis LEGE 11480 TaxID=2777977 RepID=A0A928Z1H3_9CYAN|nr:hypothetical protein [Romeriopsis navalis]MBE9028504.1 hypothetical protein [Romeriopsis navalis LEGE 11480]